jgi:hypothetical protein
MHRISTAFLTSALLVAAGAAAAQPAPADPVAGYYGNTLKIESGGPKELRFFEADHTFRDRVRGNVVPGVWTIEGDRICTQHPHASKFCNLGLGKVAGDSWIDHDPYTGSELRFSLIAGRKDDR